jgi:hypothetical protein
MPAQNYVPTTKRKFAQAKAANAPSACGELRIRLAFATLAASIDKNFREVLTQRAMLLVIKLLKLFGFHTCDDLAIKLWKQFQPAKFENTE